MHVLQISSNVILLNAILIKLNVEKAGFLDRTIVSVEIANLGFSEYYTSFHKPKIRLLGSLVHLREPSINKSEWQIYPRLERCPIQVGLPLFALSNQIGGISETPRTQTRISNLGKE